LAIGLQALPVIADIITTSRIGSRPGLQRAVELLLPYEALSEEIIRNWLPYAQYQDENWRAHQDINDVMLATALIPNLFLSVGKRLSLKK
jgi:hypothetical protein